MKKIISIVVMACMITGCTALKPDELVKTNIPGTTCSTGTDNSKDSQPKEQNHEQGQQENKEGFFDARPTIYYAGAAVSVIVAVGIIAAIILCKRCCNTNEKKVTYPISLKLNSDMPDNDLINGLNNLDGIEGNLSATPIDSKLIDFKIESDNADSIDCQFRATKYTADSFRLFIIIARARKRNRKCIGSIDGGKVKKGEGESITTFYLLTKLGENPRIALYPDIKFIRDLIQIVPHPRKKGARDPASDTGTF